MTQSEIRSPPSNLVTGGGILLAYLVLNVLLTRSYPSARLANPVVIGHSEDGGTLLISKDDVTYNGELVQTGFPVACFAMREEAIDPGYAHRSLMHVVATRFSFLAFILDCLFISIVIAVVIAIYSRPQNGKGSRSRWAFIGIGVACVLVILALSQVTFLEPIKIYAFQ